RGGLLGPDAERALAAGAAHRPADVLRRHQTRGATMRTQRTQRHGPPLRLPAPTHPRRILPGGGVWLQAALRSRKRPPWRLLRPPPGSPSSIARTSARCSWSWWYFRTLAWYDFVFLVQISVYGRPRSSVRQSASSGSLRMTFSRWSRRAWATGNRC